ncbi:MAG TPA: putative motility protein [Chromatiales bacterium]|nr:putative motility protein [Thiotrichales bacterium]HIP68736.1 putative motility protein [Chromatiales bacterium]
MEISAKSISDMNQLQFQAELSTRVARKALDTLEVQGKQLVQMLESVPTPSASPTGTVGLNIDVLV